MPYNRFVCFVCCLALFVAFAVGDAGCAYAEIGQGVLSTNAQTGTGVLGMESSIGSYTIFSADGERRYLGTLIVVGRYAMASAVLPQGFEAGAEYWYWHNPHAAFPTAFFLTPDEVVKLPSQQVTDYEMVPNLAFDLNDPQPFPDVKLGPSAHTYAVHIANADGKALDNHADAWFAFLGDGAHLAWAPKELNNAYLYVDTDESLLFVAASLPASESIPVVTAR